jgi:hypothetical protein
VWTSRSWATTRTAPGYILTGYAIDGGALGSGLDYVSITVLTPTGTVI